MSDKSRDRIITLTLLTLFVFAATAFAFYRTPFDDEWFSITLLTEASESQFWQSLRGDIHPPWVAMFDRFLWWIWPSECLLIFWRTLAVTLAAGLWLSLMKPTFGQRTWILALALFHPIVFYYAGAQRWYPLFMLAHGLRHWAILAPKKASIRLMTFSLGAVLGSAAGYLDPLFLLHDALHYAWRHKKEWRHVVLTLMLSASAVCLLVACSPIIHDHVQIVLNRSTPSQWGMASVQWAVLGPLGESLPHFSFFLLVPFVVAVSLLGARAYVRASEDRHAVTMCMTLVLTWLLATRFGVWLPRYSLEVWWLMGVFLLAPLGLRKEGFPSHILKMSWGALVFVFLGLVSTLSGHGFLKSDLNDPPPDFCSTLESDQTVNDYIIPYHRLRRQVESVCNLETEHINVPHIRHVASHEVLLKNVLSRANQGGRLMLLTLNSRSSLTVAENAIKNLLDAKCRRQSSQMLWSAPHQAVRQRILGRPKHRVIGTPYDCEAL